MKKIYLVVIALLCLFSSSAWAMDCYKDSLGGQSLVTTTLPTFTVPANAPAGQKIWESGDLLVTVYCDHATRDSTKPVSQDPWSEHVYAYILDSFHNTDSLMTNNPYLAFGVTYNG
ncbi:TPA: pilus assembly protein, partial [Enterobacter cloacae]|nr:pilus assembly protein [Enterobacter cloacae]HDT2156121.1 pilus assembly protein [Enterobacter cloacae]